MLTVHRINRRLTRIACRLLVTSVLIYPSDGATSGGANMGYLVAGGRRLKGQREQRNVGETFVVSREGERPNGFLL